MRYSWCNDYRGGNGHSYWNLNPERSYLHISHSTYTFEEGINLTIVASAIIK